jgi:hypothetical protein
VSLRTRFCYVDAQVGLETWKRIKLDEVDAKLRNRARNQNCFYSVQRYDEPVHRPPATNGDFQEDQWLGPFFDFDKEGDEDVPRKDALAVINYFVGLGIRKEHVRVWFSGRRGFHVLVEPETFGIEPSRDLTYNIKLAAMAVAAQLGLESFDDKVYSIRRMLRVPDSVHQKTNLFKVELTHEELHLSMDGIRGLARAHRGERYEKDSYDHIETSSPAAAWWNGYSRLFAESKKLRSLAPANSIRRPVEMVGEIVPPVCVKHLMSRTALPRPNSGNKAVLAIAAFYRDAGVPLEEAERAIADWAIGLVNIGDSGNPTKAAAMARSTTRYVYNHEEKCSFACPFILALGSGDDKIPCEHLACKWIDGKEQTTKDIIKTNLAGASHAEYQKQRISLPVRVSGKAQTPYVVPRKIEITCPAGEHEMCEGCGIMKFAGTFSHIFNESDDTLLSILNQWTAVGKGNIRGRFGIPKGCSFHRIQNVELQNVEELRLIPPAEEAGSTERTEHVVRKAYYLYAKHEDRIETNRAYKIEGVPAAEPKTQQATLLFAKAERVESEVDRFKMTPELFSQLSVFQPSYCDVAGKFAEIHDDLEANITSIWGRRLLAVSYDMAWHSVRAFKFGFQSNIKGWVEVLVVGASGCGKTATATALRRHYRAGDLLSGGTSRRTGLAYSLQQIAGTWVLMWGALPLNDLGLVIIDEFSDLKPEEFALLTDARSSGIIKVAGVISDETNARVRLICLTNPKLGRTLGSYQHGCESLRELIPGPEDIRRFDFALAVESSDVSPEILNRKVKPCVTHTYTSYLCNQLIRWTWSRRPEHIEFSAEATSAILDAAIEMSKKYASGEIPLAEPSDQRFKLARLATATACRVFSTDSTGERVLVGLEHVQYAVAHIDACYSHPHFKYDQWSKRVKDRAPDKPKVQAVVAALRKDPDWAEILDAMQKMDRPFGERDLDYFTHGRDREIVKNFMQIVVSMNLVKRVARGWVRTELFIAALDIIAGLPRPEPRHEFDGHAAGVPDADGTD